MLLLASLCRSRRSLTLGSPLRHIAFLSSNFAMADIYKASATVPVCRLEIRKHFDGLTDKQKAYAHYISRASWLGTRIVLRQVSVEAETIYNLILALFPSSEAITVLKTSSGVSEQEFTDCLQYSAQFLGNLGNYKSFGDTKFIPRLPKASFERIVKASGRPEVERLFSECADRMYALSPESVLMLGYPPSHCSTYYSANVVKEEIDLVQRFLESKNINVYNTRLFKNDQGEFVVKFASGEVLPSSKHVFEGKTIRMEYGDYQKEMAQIADALHKAIPYAANEHQRNMLEKYVESFRTGSIEAHKESQRHWIKDVGPAVESNIGFIESYRDPAGVRSEWEGFAAVVNQEQTQKFGILVENAPHLIEKLPWDKAFEKDEFLRPDFTSLEVLAFCTSGIPAGINIPK